MAANAKKSAIEVGARRRGRPKELSRAERKTAILDAAERLMVEKGLSGTSMAAIAVAARMSKRTLYEVFDNRATLFQTWVRRARTSFIRPLSVTERTLPLAERLHLLLSPVFVAPDRETTNAVLRAVVAEASRDPSVGEAFLNEGPRSVRALIRDELDHAISQGEISLDDVDLAAQLLFNMAYENPIERLVAPTLPAPSAVEAEARLCLAIRIFLSGTERQDPST